MKIHTLNLLNSFTIHHRYYKSIKTTKRQGNTIKKKEKRPESSDDREIRIIKLATIANILPTHSWKWTVTSRTCKKH